VGYVFAVVQSHVSHVSVLLYLQDVEFVFDHPQLYVGEGVCTVRSILLCLLWDVFVLLANRYTGPCCRDRRLAAEDEEYAAQVEEAQLYNNTGGDVPNQMPVMTKGGEYAPNQGQPPERASMCHNIFPSHKHSQFYA